MARGTFAGIVWGTVAAAIGAGGLSIAMGPPDRADDQGADATATQIEAPAEPAVDSAAETAPEVAAAPDAPVEPDAGDAVALSAPADQQAAPAAQDAPALAAPSEQDLPAQPLARPVAPAVGVAPEGLAETDPAPQDAGAAVGAGSDAAPDQADALIAPDAPDADAAPGAPEDPTRRPEVPEAPVQADAAPVQEGALDAPKPEAPVNAALGAAGGALTAPDADGIPELDVAPADPLPAQEEDVALAAPEQGAARPSIGEPAGSLIGRNSAVTQSRLPRIGAADPAAAAPAIAVSQSSPLMQFAAPADPEAGVPRFAVVLIDDGSGPLGPEALRSFPFPLSFAISSGHPDPAAAAAGYRANGFEVMVIANVPEGAQATDIEVSMQAALDIVPEAVAVLEAPEGGLQQNRQTSTQVAEYLASTGHGLLLQAKGLNTGQQLALRAGVPSAAVFRDLDGEGQATGVIRRVLDMAALRASQEGSVVLVGRVRADTVSALIQWGLQDRAGTISLVPASLILQESLQP